MSFFSKAIPSEPKTEPQPTGRQQEAIESLLEVIQAMTNGQYQDAVPAATDTDELTAKLVTAVGALQKKDVNLICGLLQNVMSLAGSSESLNQTSESTKERADSLTQKAESVAGASNEISENMNAIAAAAEELSVNMSTVSENAQQSSENINSVASATEEMTATVTEIAENAENSRVITNDAVQTIQIAAEKKF